MVWSFSLAPKTANRYLQRQIYMSHNDSDRSPQGIRYRRKATQTDPSLSEMKRRPRSPQTGSGAWSMQTVFITDTHQHGCIVPYTCMRRVGYCSYLLCRKRRAVSCRTALCRTALCRVAHYHTSSSIALPHRTFPHHT